MWVLLAAASGFVVPLRAPQEPLRRVALSTWSPAAAPHLSAQRFAALRSDSGCQSIWLSGCTLRHSSKIAFVGLKSKLLFLDFVLLMLFAVYGIKRVWLRSSSGRKKECFSFFSYMRWLQNCPRALLHKNVAKLYKTIAGKLEQIASDRQSSSWLQVARVVVACPGESAHLC